MYKVLFCLRVYFLLWCETWRYSRQRPCFFHCVCVCVSVCKSVSSHLLWCFLCVYACVLGCVSKSVLAACFVCCSCCDRWSAAHAQINRPTLMKSGFCLLSLSLSVLHSLYAFLLYHSLPVTSLSLNQGHIRDSEKTVQNCNHPLERWGRETGGRWVGYKTRD